MNKGRTFKDILMRNCLCFHKLNLEACVSATKRYKKMCYFLFERLSYTLCVRTWQTAGISHTMQDT